jgi:hypothetical protein
MSKRFILCSLFLIMFCFARAQDYFYKPFLVEVLQKLPEKKLFKKCSRPVPKHVSKFWIPDSNSLNTLYCNFRKVLMLKSIYAYRGRKIDSLSRFGFQFIGIVIKGKKLIYINAFDSVSNPNSEALQKDIFDVCDGGFDFWGVVFDPISKRFIDLAFNGD